MKTKKPLLLLLSLLLVAMFAFSACGNDEDMTDEKDTINEGSTVTDADREIAENDLNKGEDNDAVKIILTTPKEDEEIGGGAVTLTGKVDGKAKEVHCKLMLDDETVIGEGKALVADVSQEFTAKITYNIPEANKGELPIDCKIKMTAYDENNKEVEDESIHVRLK